MLTSKLKMFIKIQVLDNQQINLRKSESENWLSLTSVMFWRDAILSFAFLSWYLITSFFLISFINCLLLLFSSKSNLWNSTYNHIHNSFERKLCKLTSKSWSFDASWDLNPPTLLSLQHFHFVLYPYYLSWELYSLPFVLKSFPPFLSERKGVVHLTLESKVVRI